MIDTVAILISTLGVLYIIIRATQLDAILPWFSPPPAECEKPAGARPGWAGADSPSQADTRRAEGAAGWRSRLQPPQSWSHPP